MITCIRVRFRPRPSYTSQIPAHISVVVHLLNSCLTLCDPMDCRMPGFPVLHCLQELPQTVAHPTISSSVIPFSSCLQFFPASGSFLMTQLFASGGQSIGASVSTSALPMNIQDWFPLWLTGFISLKSKELSRVFSSTTVWEHINSLAFDLLCGPTLTTVHDYRKNYSFDYTDFCWESDVSAF